MLRMLRITGIVIFAMLVGIAANNLWKMYENGNLTERYNSARKANITMMVFSVVAVGALGFFELSRIRRYSSRRGYGGARYTEDKEEQPKEEGLDSTSIYSAPPTIDAWQGRRTRSSKSRSKQKMEKSSIWMGLLRVCCVLMPLIYGGLLARNLLASSVTSELAWVLPAVYGWMVLLSAITAIGLMAKKTWGITLGYVLAICNLMIFPLGTALGLFLIMGLVGASAEFAVPEREKRRAARRKAASRAQALI